MALSAKKVGERLLSRYCCICEAERGATKIRSSFTNFWSFSVFVGMVVVRCFGFGVVEDVGSLLEGALLNNRNKNCSNHSILNDSKIQMNNYTVD